jgi:putative salt-induced outer membrane protein YdiY
MRPLTVALLLILCAAATVSADEVRLKNGDRLTGDLISLGGGTLAFKAAYGAVNIPWSDVDSLAVTGPIIVTVGTAAPATVTTIASDAPGRVTLQPGGTVAIADIQALARPQPALIVSGGANAGFLTTAGNTDVNNLRLDADVVARAGPNRYTAGAAVNHASDHGAETAESWTGLAKYDRFLSTRLFVNANAILTHDAFRDLDLRTALGAGLGYQVIDTPLVTLTADAGLGYVRENLDAAPDGSYAAARESAKLDVFVLPGRIQLFHNHDGYFGVTGDDNLFFRMQNGARLALAAGFITTLELDLDYDRSPAPGRDNTDRTFALTLGYRF